MDHQLGSMLEIYFNVEELTRYLFCNHNILFSNDFFQIVEKNVILNF
jgi:hypothetical protein